MIINYNYNTMDASTNTEINTNSNPEINMNSNPSDWNDTELYSYYYNDMFQYSTSGRFLK